MSGKAYTMKEMLSIVQYLSENKYYSELKGRKMWIDFSNTLITNRTWQSLKETFLKRILPDIHNPYYKLSKEQIISFRQGYDVQKNAMNKLEVQTISDDTNSDEGQQKDNKQQTTSDINAGEKAGEDIKCSKITNRNRYSADTVVIIENAYDTAEDIQKVLESPKPNNQIQEVQKQPKKFKDFITYSEPLAPILQGVLNDFASDTESSDREPVMEIDERKPDRNDEDNISKKLETVKEIVTTKTKESDCAIESTEKVDNVIQNEIQNSEIEPIQMPVEIPPAGKLDQEIPVVEKDTISEEPISNIKNTENNETYFSTTKESNIIKTCSEIEKEDNANQNNSENSNITDSLLPNNQEGLKASKIQIEKSIEENNTENAHTSPIKSPRKRSISEGYISHENKKQKMDLNTKTKKIKSNINKNIETISNHAIETVMEDVQEIVADETNSSINNPTTSKDTLLENKQTEETLVEKDLNAFNSQTEKMPLKDLSPVKEQFNLTKNSDNESNEVRKLDPATEGSKNDMKTNTKVHKEDVVILSESDSNNHDKRKEKNTNIVSHNIKSQRDRALADMFGFSTGGGTSDHKTKLKRKRSNCHHKKIHTAPSESSEWTSGSESEEYVSPPPGRRGKHTRKCFKLKSSRLISLEEENGLFALCGDKILPIMKNGKIVKSVRHLRKSDSEDPDEAYWRLKYKEEKKKNDELKRLLDQSREPSVSRDRASLKQRTNSHRQESTDVQHQQGIAHDYENYNVNRRSMDAHSDTTKEEKIKIKFTKNNEEVHLEGRWPQIHPVLEQIVNIFHKETEAKTGQSNSKTLGVPEGKVDSSGLSTPLTINDDPEVHKKVDIIEKEIFQEIEERDKEENLIEEIDNVTKRTRRLSRNPSVASVKSTKKRSKSGMTDDETKTGEDNVENVPQVTTETRRTPNKENITELRQTRASRKVSETSLELAEKSPKKYRTRHSAKMENGDSGNDVDGIRYMLPPQKNTGIKKSYSKKTPKNAKSLRNAAEVASPDSLSRISESTQGYHESDISPIQLKRKKRLSTIVRSSKRPNSRNTLRRYQRIKLYNLSESSNSSCSKSKFIQTQRDCSEIYKSESYKCLFPNRNRSSKRLDSIDELETIHNSVELRHFEAVSNEEHSIDIKTHVNDVGSSSSYSLPLSPELSLVESITLRKDMIMSTEDHPTINEIQCNNNRTTHTDANFFIPDVDVTIPLLQQSCEEIQEKETPVVDHTNKTNKTTVSESLLNGIGSVKIYDNSSDSIDRKLEELLLESNKKDKHVQYMEIDDNNTVTKTKKSRAKKRCSTPHKKRESNNRKVSKIDAIIEEHVETYSNGGRASCPPSIQVFDDNAMDYEDNTIKKGRRKKDVIKVKISKPKLSIVKNNYETVVKNNNSLSVLTDSGINDTDIAMFPPDTDDSVKLIHNHSETCLHANECIEERLECVTIRSSYESDSLQSTGSSVFDIKEFLHNEDIAHNVHDFQLFKHEYNTSKNRNILLSPTEMEVNCSLITEDLSDETSTHNPPVKPTKWYLLSEDDTSICNTNIPPQTGAGWGANLNHIFPITCSVPNLSVITEASRENEDSKKPEDV